jgi:hypothetical protein
MIKIGVVIADVVSSKSSMEINEEGQVVTKDLLTEKIKGVLSIPFLRMQEVIFSFLTAKNGKVVSRARASMGKGSDQNNDGTGGKQTFGNAKEGGYNYAYEPPPPKTNGNAGDTNNTPPENNTPTFDGQRDTNAP